MVETHVEISSVSSRHYSTFKSGIRVQKEKLETSASFSTPVSQKTSVFLFTLVMAKLRVCYLRTECFFNEECGIPRLGQQFKSVADTVLSGFNVSLVPKDPTAKEYISDGDFANNSPFVLGVNSSNIAKPTITFEEDLDPCLVSLQNNESDVTYLSYSMPVMLSNIKTGPVARSERIAMVSSYKLDEDDSASEGILGTFQAFSIDACCLIAQFFIILFALFSLAYIFERRRTRPDFKIDGRRFNLRFIPWFFFCFFAKQIPSFPGDLNLTKAILICNLLTYSYFVTFYYSSMIKTDMVTVKTPKIIGSYQGLLDDPEIEPLINHLHDEYVSFKTAPKGSVKRKIWERILSQGIDKHVIESKKGDAIMSFADLNGPFLNGKAAIFAFPFQVNAWKYILGLMAKSLSEREQDPRNIRFLYVYDKSEMFVTTTYVMNALTAQEVAKKYSVRRTRLVESGIVDILSEKYAVILVQSFADQFPGFGQDISDADEYYSSRVVLPEAVIVKPDMTYFLPLLVLYFVLCFLAFVLFLIERWLAKE